MGRIRLLRGLVLEVELGVGGWLGELGSEKRLEGFAAEMERRLGVSGGWLLDLFGTGSWIPSPLSE